MAAIGFLVIGAQKGGTTSLFEYMRTHPQIHMPAEKEIAFFSSRYDRGWDWYAAKVLRNAQPGAACGEASIEYMVGTPFAEVSRNDRGYRPPADELPVHLEAVIPERIRGCLPDVKLICVLRDPVARAYSHYQMAVLDRVESRTFDAAISALASPQALSEARIVRTSTNGYIVNGEYHRVLRGFSSVFPSDQLLVLFSNELSREPAATLARVFSFIGVDSGFMPPNIDTVYRLAATEARFPPLDLYAWQRVLAGSTPIRRLWHLLPNAIQERVDRGYSVAGYRTTMWNAKRNGAQENMSATTRAALIQHFLSDSQALGQLVGMDIPWLTDPAWRA